MNDTIRDLITDKDIFSFALEFFFFWRFFVHSRAFASILTHREFHFVFIFLQWAFYFSLFLFCSSFRFQRFLFLLFLWFRSSCRPLCVRVCMCAREAWYKRYAFCYHIAKMSSRTIFLFLDFVYVCVRLETATSLESPNISSHCVRQQKSTRNENEITLKAERCEKIP